MADTTTISINDTEWTEVSSGTDGFLSNESDIDILYREAATAPADTVIVGHTLRPRQGKTYSLGASQELYGRSTTGSALIVLTPDA